MPTDPTAGAVRMGRAALLVLLAYWTFVFLVWPMRQDTIGDTWLHLVNLPFHEAGHIIFSPFGDLMTSLGGSLMQVLVPVALCIAFLTTSKDLFGAAVTAWWAGENLLDVAIYINDARALQLVLLGGHTGAEVEGHDWEHILQLTNLLAYDHRIAWTTHVVGAIVMIGALIFGTLVAIDPERFGTSATTD
ncbi:MAG TPA: hypothetical protein VGY57_04855 [Vicinamibacterales bacterium]|nr:hypothetical protein [Vicinamibacterales bacterium]